MTRGRGRPESAISQRTAPNEKNQNSSPAQNRCVVVARAKAVKNVWLKIAQIGSRKIANTNFTQRVGTVRGSGPAMKPVGLARATLRTTFLPRLDLRVMRSLLDFRFFALRLVRRLRGLRRIWKSEIYSVWGARAASP